MQFRIGKTKSHKTRVEKIALNYLNIFLRIEFEFDDL